MDKQELEKLVSNVYEEAFLANEYLAVLKQYQSIFDTYYDEISYSPAFYNTVMRALHDALFVELAKLYDTGNKASGLQYLLKCCPKNTDLFPQNAGVIHAGENEYSIPHQITLKKDEECFFPGKAKPIHDYLDSPGAPYCDNPVKIELTIEEYFLFMQKKLSKLNSARDSLREQRNKYYAHFDRAVNFDLEKLQKASPLFEADIDNMVSFAIDFCQGCSALLTGKICGSLPININDLENTLELVKYGAEYQKKLSTQSDDSNE